MKSRKSKKDKQYSGQTIEDTNGEIIRHRSKKDRTYNGKMIEDTNGGIIRHRSKKDRKCNDKERKKDKRTNNDVQNTTQKTKD